MPGVEPAQPDPILALGLFFTLGLVLVVLAWPGKGVLARLAAMRRLTERVRLEDGLKHLFTAATAGATASPESLAGALGISPARAIEVARRLERLDLARIRPDGIRLTESGTQYALRVVRTHRLWERYLADRTGMGPADWHAEAEHLEHRLSEEQVEGLAARMGHPLYDPHGDPIPTAAGVLPPLRGVSLTEAEPGALVRVVHVEDEPEEVFRALRAAGLDLGSRLRIQQRTPTRLHLLVEGSEQSIDLLAARNLTVSAVDDGDDEADIERLDALRPGESGVVVRLSGAVRGAQRRRLLDLGVVPGTLIHAELSSASGDPVAYRIRGAVIALRDRQAHQILIRRPGRREAA